MVKIKEQISHSVEETENIASSMIFNIKWGDWVALSGPLGGGKTAFVRGFVEALGSSAQVSSPTFSIMNEYETNRGRVCHLDLYRLEAGEIAASLDLEEYKNNQYLIFVEWPDKLDKTYYNKWIYFDYLDGDRRSIKTNF